MSLAAHGNLFAFVHLALGNHKSFFSREPNLLKCSAYCPVTDIVLPQLCHFHLRLIWVRRHKGSECFPIGDFMAMTPMLCRLWFNISRFGFELKPLVDGIAANPEQFARFATFHPIEFDCFDHFAAQVIVVGFGHRAN